MASSKSDNLQGAFHQKTRCETIARIGASRLRLKDRETISNLAANPPLSLFLLPVIPAPRTPVSRISYRLYQPARQNAPSGIGWAICCQTWSIKVCQVLSVLNCYLDGLPHPLPLLLLLIVLLTTTVYRNLSLRSQLYTGCRKPRSILFPKELFDRNRNRFLQRQKISMRNVKIFFILRKGDLHYCSDSSTIIVNFLRQAVVKFLCREFTSYPD